MGSNVRSVATNLESMSEEIATIRRALEAAENRHDPSVQIDRRDDDRYRRLPPGRPPMSRREADESLESLYSTGGFSVDWESDGPIVGTELAVDSGQFTVTFDDGNERTGNWLLVYRRDDHGDWRIIRDIYNYID